MPNNIDIAHTWSLQEDIQENRLPLTLSIAIKTLQSLHGWQFFVVNQTRGRCVYQKKEITIPVWVINKKQKGEYIWYIAHEVSHAWNWINHTEDEHGPEFMRLLKMLCPHEYQHWELTYKPRNAMSAGLSIIADI